MRTPGELRILVHVAGAPVHTPATANAGAQLAQRCAVCGFVLVDNTGWLTGATVVKADDEAYPGPSWFPAGALVGTDKTDENRGGMTYVKPEGMALDANEQACS